MTDDHAYPFPGTSKNLPTRGLTKRELFAAMALQGLFASGEPMDYADRAGAAVHAADALIEALDRPSQGESKP